MSFVHATCAWCGDDYTREMVGHSDAYDLVQFVGSGHTCTADIACEHTDCTNIGDTLVSAQEDRGDTESFNFSCSEHIGDRRVIGHQHRKSDDE